ncbi:MAG: isochorismatase family cysteine hydrolase [Pseudomonadota bacterium]
MSTGPMIDGDFPTMDEHTEPQWSRSAVVTIDVQRDFTLSGAPFRIPGTEEALPDMQRLLIAFRAAFRPIIHVVRFYLPDGSNADPCRRKAISDGLTMAAPGTPGADLVDELPPRNADALDCSLLMAGRPQQIASNEWVIYKPRFGAFYQTCLEDLLHALGVTTLVVIGCNFPNCPRTTIYEATERDFRVVAVHDAISGVYERGMEELRNIGVVVLSADQTLESIKSLTR